MLISKGPLQNFDVNKLEAQLVKRDRRRLYVAFGAAIVLHASSVVGFTYWTPPEPVAPPGDMVVTIDLTPAAFSQAENGSAGQAQPEAAPTETPSETPEEIEPVETAEPEPPEPVKEEAAPEPPPPEPIKEEVIEQPTPEPQPESDMVQENIETPPPAEKPAVALSPKKVEKPVQKKRTPPKRKAASKDSQSARSTSDRRAEVAGLGANASPTEINKYAGRVRSAIERRKRMPAGAGQASGVAHVEFMISRSGGITGVRLRRSSGNALLDTAALASVTAANIPPIPAGLPDVMPFGVPIRFN